MVNDMTDLEKLKNTFNEIGIKYSVNMFKLPTDHTDNTDIFIWGSNLTLVFDVNGKYIYSDISV